MRDRRSGVVGGKPKALLEQLTRIADALEALVVLNAPDAPTVDQPECEHEWIDLGGEQECRKCQAKQ